jgi:hypothetical protein
MNISVSTSKTIIPCIVIDSHPLKNINMHWDIPATLTETPHFVTDRWRPDIYSADFHKYSPVYPLTSSLYCGTFLLESGLLVYKEHLYDLSLFVSHSKGKNMPYNMGWLFARYLTQGDVSYYSTPVFQFNTSILKPKHIDMGIKFNGKNIIHTEFPESALSIVYLVRRMQRFWRKKISSWKHKQQVLVMALHPRAGCDSLLNTLPSDILSRFLK